MSDIEKHNAMAIKSALSDQNKRLDEFQEKLTAVMQQITMLADGLQQLRMTTMQDIAQRFGHGPTE